jgi:hypothetical protein
MTKLHPVALILGLLTLGACGLVLFAFMPTVMCTLCAAGLLAAGPVLLVRIWPRAREEADGQEEESE